MHSPIRPSQNLLVTLALGAAWLLHAGLAEAQFHTQGWWRGPYSLGVQGTHLVVLRDPTTDKTRVLMIGETSGLRERSWSFVAGDNVSVPVLSGPGANVITLPYPGVSLFCSGHCT